VDQPLDSGNWPLIAASGEQYVEGVSQTARAATRDDMDRIQADFVRATQSAAQAGFDWLELHCAHGYLLSSFISPLTNKRVDEYGGSLNNRCRYPLQVLIARLFKEAGADMIDCSSGQVSRRQQPVYGRMFQTPFADRVRNEADIPTIAVGSIYEADHANGIIAAGRADLCALARPHLANPSWTLMEAAKVGYHAVSWPKQYQSAKGQLERNLAREREQAGSNAGLSAQQVAVKLLEG
jgi:anthraniloyl-CoA monooxygenase